MMIRLVKTRATVKIETFLSGKLKAGMGAEVYHARAFSGVLGYAAGGPPPYRANAGVFFRAIGPQFGVIGVWTCCGHGDQGQR